MNVPKEGPMGVEMLIHEKGAFLTVEEEAPFWMFWKTTRSCTASLDRWGLIWLYQTCAKILRRNVMGDNYNELAYDIQSILPAMNEEVVRQVAQQLLAKGWVKS